VLLNGTGFVALAALIIPAFGVLSALVSVMLTALLVGFILRPKIRVSGPGAPGPERLMVGQTAQLRYVLKNVARFSAYNLSVRFDALPESIEQVGGGYPRFHGGKLTPAESGVVSRLGPGETTEVTIAIRAKRRGYYRIKQPICQSSFPFNLFSFGISGNEDETVIVLPVFSLLQMPIRRLSRHVCSSGTRLSGRTGVFSEYAGSRPYLPGDSPRNIDARAWARLAVPATKEYHNDFDNYAALVLDTGVPEAISSSKSNESKAFEAAVSLCVSVAFTINNDCLIDILLAGRDLHQFSGQPRMVRLNKIHEILAGVESSTEYSLEDAAAILPDKFYEISEVIFILLNWDKAYQRMLELAGRAGCHCKVFLIGDPSKMRMVQDNVSWAGDVQFLSPDEILTGTIKYL
jgi:hypothetical protein